MAGCCCRCNWRAALVAFVVPWFTIRFLMMVGNWGQHAFIDARRPGDSYVNAITCINSGYNARASTTATTSAIT